MTRSRTERRGPRAARENKSDRTGRTGSSTLGPQSLDIHIEELVLHGFAAADRRRIGEAMRQELIRLAFEAREPRLVMRGTEADRIDGGGFQMGRDSRADTVGTHIAQAVYRAMTRK